MNNVSIIGLVHKDPDIAEGPNGEKIVNFLLRNDRKYKNGGIIKNDNSLFDCVAYGNVADVIGRNFFNGSKIAITGHLKQKRWTTRSGEKKDNVVIVVDKFTYIDEKEYCHDS